MYITLDILQKRGACQEYIDFFTKHFPDGVEMLDMIEHGHLSYHALHWGYQWLDPNEEEVSAYWRKVHVTDSIGIHESDHISNSQAVDASSQVSGSSYIYHSENIENSNIVYHGKFVDNSHRVCNGEFVSESGRVLNSKNVSGSNEVVDSVYVVNSHGVIDSSNIVDSHTIYRGENLTNCVYCADCKNLLNALFCTNIADGEYYLFNKKIDKARFDMIYKQFSKYSAPVQLMKDIDSIKLSRIYDYRKYVENIPDSFWQWVKTLPGYDSTIKYSLTFLPQFLN